MEGSNIYILDSQSMKAFGAHIASSSMGNVMFSTKIEGLKEIKITSPMVKTPLKLELRPTIIKLQSSIKKIMTNLEISSILSKKTLSIMLISLIR